MRIKSACVIAVSLLFASTAMAKICKTVGPDGSVTYTDRPTASCDTAAAPPEPSKSPAAAQTPAGAKKAVRATPESQAPQGDNDAERKTAIEKSVIGIMGLEDLVQRSHDLCIKALPTSMRRYGAAAEGWGERNASATVKMRRALAQAFAPEQQRLIAEGVKVRNEQQLRSMTSAPKADQIKWCDQTAGEIEARAFDVKDTLIAPLATY